MYRLLASGVIVAVSLLPISSIATPLSHRDDNGDNGSCAALNQLCISQVDASVSSPWAVKSCVLAASCYESGNITQVDDYLATLYAAKSVEVGDAPYSANLPRVSSSVLYSLSSDGETITQQNYIDAYYSTLDELGGPYPTDSYVVQSYYNTLSLWNGCSGRSLSLVNWEDFFQWSSLIPTVTGFTDCESITTSIPLNCISAQLSATNLILGDGFNVGFNSTYNVSVALEELGLEPTENDEVGGLPVLSGQPSYPGTPVDFQFCNSTYLRYPLAKENTPSAGLFVYYGQLIATNVDPEFPAAIKCLGRRSVSGRDFIVQEDCFGSDDSAQLAQFWRADQNILKGYEEVNFTMTFLGAKNYETLPGWTLTANGSSAVIIDTDASDPQPLYTTYIHVN